MAKGYNQPPVAWIRIAEYMHGGLQYHLGGEVKVGGRPVICLWHLSGARSVLRMETCADFMLEPAPDRETIAVLQTAQGGERRPVSLENAMSATRHGVIETGLKLDAEVTERLYGLSREDLHQYIPIECPRLCLTSNGVIRPWTNDVCFGKEQTRALQRLLRDVFWKQVEEYAALYTQKRHGMKYPQVEMIESFCDDTETPDIHIEAIRREWQRRQKRKMSTNGTRQEL